MAEVTEGLVDHRVKQFSLFMANRVGRFLDVVSLFTKANIHIVALTVLDTSDSAIVRLIVDDPDTARKMLHEHSLMFTETSMIVVEMANSAEDLQPVLQALLQAECNIQFMYSFLTRPRGKAALALHVEDEEVANSVLLQNGFKLLMQRDISR